MQKYLSRGVHTAYVLTQIGSKVLFQFQRPAHTTSLTPHAFPVGPCFPKQPERAATALPAATVGFPVVSVDANLASCTPTDNVDNVDDLLQVVAAVQEENNGSVYGEVRSSGSQGDAPGRTAVVAYDTSMTRTTIAPNKTNGLSLEVTAKRRRCGTVRLAGTATRRGFCASSLSQW